MSEPNLDDTMPAKRRHGSEDAGGGRDGAGESAQPQDVTQRIFRRIETSEQEEETTDYPEVNLSAQSEEQEEAGEESLEPEAAGEVEEAIFQEVTREVQSDKPISADGASEDSAQELETSPETEVEGTHSRPWVRWIIVAVIALLVVAVLAGLGGYASAVQQRVAQAEIQSAVEAVTQYELGLADLEAGRYDIARQRFEYVIQINPDYPGAADQLTKALLALNATATPTIMPTPTATATPDLRGEEELFNQAQALLVSQDWSALLETLDSLRKKNAAFNPVQVDGMYYAAYRGRGADRILINGDLEGGIYDLNLAEKYGPLDTEANSYRQWASWHVTALSFWEVDWAEVVFYLNQVAAAAPQLWDGSFSAADRLATAQVGYGHDLVEEAEFLLSVKGWCAADEKFAQAAQYITFSEEVNENVLYAAEKCELNPDEEPLITPSP